MISYKKINFSSDYFIPCQDHDARKIANWNAKLMKIEEASRKKDEINQEFISYAKENLVTKMEHSEVKRDAIISDMREKIRVRN